jgi:hypothetical protein
LPSVRRAGGEGTPVAPFAPQPARQRNKIKSHEAHRLQDRRCCTDIGTRTIVAIRIDTVEVQSDVPALRRTLTTTEAEAEGWFNGPPYSLAEVVFVEDDIESCSTTLLP